jgi:competence protein ComGC
MNRLKMFAREEGFSLLELMVVIVIIGVLVSIAVVSFTVSVRASKKTVCKTNLRIIEEQVLVYRVKYDENPPTLQDLVPEFINKEDALRCPESGEAYIYDPATGDASCPYHTDL